MQRSPSLSASLGQSGEQIEPDTPMFADEKSTGQLGKRRYEQSGLSEESILLNKSADEQTKRMKTSRDENAPIKTPPSDIFSSTVS